MSLDLASLIPQLRKFGHFLTRQYEEAALTLPALIQALSRASEADRAMLQRKIERAGSAWFPARPSDETIHQSFPAPKAPKRYHVVGADGSQVEPDRHASALYYLINIGSIQIEVGSGHAPQTHSSPQLFFNEEDLYGDGMGLIHSDLIRAQRDVAELYELLRVANHLPDEPMLALLDNGLRLWLSVQDRSRDRERTTNLIQAYQAGLSELETTGVALAGYIDRPRHADVIRLLYLADLDLEEINEANLYKNPYRRFTDRALFLEKLKPNERSALFFSPRREGDQQIRPEHEIQFFYLHTGYDHQIARVEIPTWVANSPVLLNLVHAGLVEQCSATGLPFALVRAHELAVVAGGDRRILTQALDQVLLDAGITPRLSQKSLTKRWTSQP